MGKIKLTGTSNDFRNICLEFSVVISIFTILGLIMAIITNTWALFIAPLCLTIIFLLIALIWHIKYKKEKEDIEIENNIANSTINEEQENKTTHTEPLPLKSIYNNPSDYIIKPQKDDDTNG